MTQQGDGDPQEMSEDALRAAFEGTFLEERLAFPHPDYPKSAKARQLARRQALEDELMARRVAGSQPPSRPVEPGSVELGGGTRDRLRQ